MAIKSTDLYFHAAFVNAIADIRKNEFIQDDIISDVKSDPLLSTIYGQKEIDKFKRFMKKEIQVNLEFTLDMAKLPAIAIRVGGGSEVADRTGDALGDGFQQENINASSTYGVYQYPSVKAGPITPVSYDPITGQIILPDTINTDRIFEGMIVQDEVNHVAYPITLVSDSQTIYIAEGSQPNLTSMTIRVKEASIANVVRSFFTTEEVVLICMSTDSAEVLYLYSLVMYIYGRYKMELFDGKNFKIGTLRYGQLYKAIEDPNNIFARDITMVGQVEHTYISQTGPLLQGVSTRVDIDSMGATPPGYVPEEQAQGWGSPLDSVPSTTGNTQE